MKQTKQSIDIQWNTKNPIFNLTMTEIRDVVKKAGKKEFPKSYLFGTPNCQSFSQNKRNYLSFNVSNLQLKQATLAFGNKLAQALSMTSGKRVIFLKWISSTDSIEESPARGGLYVWDIKYPLFEVINKHMTKPNHSFPTLDKVEVNGGFHLTKSRNTVEYKV